jgi:Mg2+-importing ATPase
MHLDGVLNPGGQPLEEVFRLVYLNALFETGLTNPLDEAILTTETKSV